jgi:MYXO-CTERM domain-containing protein
MRLLLSVGLVLLWACAPAEPSAATRRDALSMPALVTSGGEGGAQLGWALAPCPVVGAVVLASAPGLPAAWRSSTGAFTSRLGDAGQLGQVLVCDPGGAAVVGGPGGLFRVQSDGGWASLRAGSWLSAARLSTSRLIALDSAGTVHVLDWDGTSVSQNSLLGTPRLVTAVSSTQFVLADPQNQKVSFFSLLNDQPQPLGSASFASVTGFGRAMAVGDVTPANPGPELIVGASGQVLILSLDGGVLNTLGIPNDLSFGAAVATEPSEYLALDALWVGAPGSDRAFRFIGDAGTLFAPAGVSGAQFGAAITATNASFSPAVYFGAPAYGSSEEGAVFSVVAATSGLVATVRECGLTRPCDGCPAGPCLGGVVCLQPGSNPTCTGGKVCNGTVCVDPPDGGASEDAGMINDAGVITDAGVNDDAGVITDAGVNDDAGVVTDAGVNDDAGVIADAGVNDDAGVITDAGVNDDAGVITDAGVAPGDLTFSAGCGCAGVSDWPVALVGLVLLARRRR